MRHVDVGDYLIGFAPFTAVVLAMFILLTSLGSLVSGLSRGNAIGFLLLLEPLLVALAVWSARNGRYFSSTTTWTFGWLVPILLAALVLVVLGLSCIGWYYYGDRFRYGAYRRRMQGF
ncbi:hypothetical protein HUN08_04585 [Gordonia sp. X0973]|nr:hypothetical protein HUN08_04585 [Gordonia sp. X0973]